MREEWKGFKNGAWEKEINVRDFIQKNYEPYDGDASFLAGPTQQIYGIRYLIFRRKKEQLVVFLIWIQRLYQQSHHMVQDI